jgi:hypothetical protein
MMNAEQSLPCGCAVPAQDGWVGLVDPGSELLLTLDGSGQILCGFPHDSELASARVCKVRFLDELFERRLATLLSDRAQVVRKAAEPSSIDVSIHQHDGGLIAARVRIAPRGEGVVLLMRRTALAARRDSHVPGDDSSFWQLFDAAPIPLAVEVATNSTGEGLSRLNRKFTTVFGYDSHDVPSVQHWWPLAYPDPVYREEVRRDWFRRVSEADARGEVPTMETTVVCKDGSRREIEFGVAVIGARHVVSFVDLTESRRSQHALSARVEELRAALEENTRLRRLLPVCAWCRKLRNDHGYWFAVEEFIAQSPDVTLTHGICPDCRARHLGK